jgi:hypothetical protein
MLDEVTANESGAAGDKNGHSAACLPDFKAVARDRMLRAIK